MATTKHPEFVNGNRFFGYVYENGYGYGGVFFEPYTFTFTAKRFTFTTLPFTENRVRVRERMA